MPARSLKDTHKINQKYRDIVFGYVKRVQALFSDDNVYFNIVDIIIHLILLYYYSIFESSILNDNEKDKLIKLLEINQKSILDYEWKLIFDSQKHGLNQECKNMSQNLSLVFQF